MNNEPVEESHWETLSNPTMPGIALLRVVDVERGYLLDLKVSLDEWNRIDAAMRDSLAKYSNPSGKLQ